MIFNRINFFVVNLKRYEPIKKSVNNIRKIVNPDIINIFFNFFIFELVLPRFITN